MSKVYVFLAEGFEEIEGLTVVDLLRRAKIETEMVSIMETKQVKGSHGIEVTADCLFTDRDYADASVLVLPGGMPGTLNLGNHEGLCELLKKHYGEEKMIAAICAAPSVFGQLGFLNGRIATCYPGFEDQLLGARYVNAPTVTDGNVITARGAGAAFEFGFAIVDFLEGSREKSKELRESMQCAR
jgi:4-methyl-5(b-hydroxyethyl)-thiazole monophosphate biosynthesis